MHPPHRAFLSGPTSRGTGRQACRCGQGNNITLGYRRRPSMCRVRECPAVRNTAALQCIAPRLAESSKAMSVAEADAVGVNGQLDSADHVVAVPSPGGGILAGAGVDDERLCSPSDKELHAPMPHRCKGVHRCTQVPGDAWTPVASVREEPICGESLEAKPERSGSVVPDWTRRGSRFLFADFRKLRE